MNDDKRLKRKVRNSYIISTISMALVLFLLGSVGYLMFAAIHTAASLKEHISITVELSNDSDEASRSTVEQWLADEEMVQSIFFVSKEEKLNDAEFRKLFGAQFEEVLGENPLLDSYEVTLTAQSDDLAEVEALLERIRQLKGVQHADFPIRLAEQIHDTVNKIRLILFLFGGALLVISLILLNNTIRLAIFSKRYLINTMKLVGATKWFIMKPFLASSISQGLGAGALASMLFIGALYGLNEAIPDLRSMADITQIATILGAMMGGGVVISMLFTSVALNHFINMKSNKIYLY